MNRQIAAIIICAILVFEDLPCGSRWKEINAPKSTRIFTSIDFADSLDGILFSPSGVYAITTDGGNTWKLDSLPISGTLSQVKYFGHGSCWIQIDSAYNKSSLYYSTNGGEWTRKQIPDTLNYFKLACGFATERKIFIATRKGLMSTEDGGSTWNLSLKAGNLYSSISFADSMVGLACFSGDAGIGTRPCLSFRTSNSGLTWDTLSTESIAYDRVRFYNSNSGYLEWAFVADDALWWQRGIMLTNDGGKTFWKTQTAGLGITSTDWHYPLCGIKYPSSQVFTLWTNSQLKKDLLDGSFIVTEKDTTATGIVAFESVSENYNWILTSNNRLFQSIGVPTDASSEVNRQSNSRFILYPNYPNPFNPTTTISFDLSKSAEFSLAIYDCLGRQVSTLAHGYRVAGHYEEHFNAGDLSGGVYFCRLVIDKHVMINKLVLLK